MTLRSNPTACVRAAGVVMVLLSLGVASAYAQTSPPAPPVPPPQVWAVRDDTRHLEPAHLNDRIILWAAGLQAWVAAERIKSPGTDVKQGLVLYLEDTPLPDLHPYAIDEAGEKLYFTLSRTSQNRDVWDRLFARPGVKAKDVKISVGPSAGPPWPTGLTVASHCLSVVALPPSFLYAIGLWLAMLVAVVVLARRTGLLRDAGAAEEARSKTFSLARVSLAFWFLIILGCYLVLLFATRETQIPDGILILMGIGSGTAIAAALVDMTTGAADSVGTSRGFWRDITMEGKDVSLHRLQLVVWSIVLAGIVVVSVWHFLQFPDLPASILTILGISSGTYLGSKYPANAS